MQLDQQKLESKNQELAGHLKGRMKQHQTLQKMYTSLKQQQIAAGMESAADYDAENVLHAAATGSSKISTHRNGQAMYSRAGSHGSGESGGHRQHVNAWGSQAQGNRPGFQTSCELSMSIAKKEES